MRSRATPRFWKLYAALPAKDQALAQKAFELWLANPSHPSLHFKEVEPQHQLWSVRISARLRALGRRQGDRITWSWIGDHDAYMRMIRQS